MLKHGVKEEAIMLGVECFLSASVLICFNGFFVNDVSLEPEFMGVRMGQAVLCARVHICTPFPHAQIFLGVAYCCSLDNIYRFYSDLSI